MTSNALPPYQVQPLVSTILDIYGSLAFRYPLFQHISFLRTRQLGRVILRRGEVRTSLR